MRKIKIKFAQGNAKLSKRVAILSLPAGYSCPGARDCLSRANKVTGKIADGRHTEFRCFAASAEALFRNIRISRWRNFDALRTAGSVKATVDIISSSLPKRAKLVRMHGSGDFFSQSYFDAWCQVSRLHPDRVFYGYTKALNFWTARLDSIPENMKLVASRGGRFDHLIAQHGLRSCRVVYSEQEATDLGLELDHDDSHVYKGKGDFALLLHGTQPAGSEAGKAYSALKRDGQAGYSGIGQWFSEQKKG
jgi:hypothetical protein